MDIANFRTAIMTRGIMKPNRFAVRPFAPPGLAGRFGEVVRDMELWAEAVDLPVFALEAHGSPRYGYGPDEKRIIRPTYQDIRLSLISDEGMDHWRFFKEWLDLVVESDMSTGITGGSGADPYEINYKSEYLASLNIVAFDERGEEKVSVILRDAYPIALEAIPLQWANNQEYLKIPIVFTFTDWYEE